MSELLRARRIGRRFGGEAHWGFRDLSLRVGAGDRVLLGGPSGAGKSLILRALALLDPLSTGEILWRGEPIPDSGIPRYRGDVAYLHQSPALVEGTAEDNLRLPFSLALHADRDYEGPHAVELLDHLGFGEALLKRGVADLSGGERQIVALVRLLQLSPSLLLLDEPTAALDRRTSERAARLIDVWTRQSPDRAFVWIAHDPEMVRPIARREWLCEGGSIHEAT